jgi:hypothetical protein
MAATTSHAKSGSSRSTGRSRATQRSTASKSRTAAANGSSQTSRGRNAATSGASGSSGSSRSQGGSHLSGASLVNSLPHISAPSIPNMPSMPHMNGTAKTVMGNVVVPLTTAAAGVAGGIVLARTKLQHRRKVLGVPLPGTKKMDLSDLTKQVGEAGRQFGNLAGEVRAAREKAEQISKAIGS